MEFFENIIIGIVGSIVTTIILFLCSKLYKIGYKEDFLFNLSMAKTAVYQINNQHTFPSDYDLVIAQIDVLYKCAFEMYKSIYPFSLLFKSKNKKIIMTLLYDIIRVCERSKFMTVGYNGESENEARLNEIHKCFYKCKSLEKNNYSTVLSQLDLLENLITGKNFIQSIKKQFSMELTSNKKEFLRSFQLEYIEINSFRIKKSKFQSSIKNQGITNDDFNKMIDKVDENLKM